MTREINTRAEVGVDPAGVRSASHGIEDEARYAYEPYRTRTVPARTSDTTPPDSQGSSHCDIYHSRSFDPPLRSLPIDNDAALGGMQHGIDRMSHAQDLLGNAAKELADPAQADQGRRDLERALRQITFGLRDERNGMSQQGSDLRSDTEAQDELRGGRIGARETQQHIDKALEMLKNGDVATALDEIKKAQPALSDAIQGLQTGHDFLQDDLDFGFPSNSPGQSPGSNYGPEGSSNNNGADGTANNVNNNGSQGDQGMSLMDLFNPFAPMKLAQNLLGGKSDKQEKQAENIAKKILDPIGIFSIFG